MSASSSINSQNEVERAMSRRSRVVLAAALPLWVALGFGVAQLALVAVLYVLSWFGVSFVAIDPAVANTVIAACVYVLSLAIVVGVPWLLKKRPTTKNELGLARLPSWTDIALMPAGFVIYFLASALLVYGISALVPGLDLNQSQETGFQNVTTRYEYMLAFVTLIVIAPIAEEILFRGYLYGKLRKTVPVWIAVLLTSALFGLVHGQWNVAIDVFALSVVLCLLREVTGNIWAGMLVHMLKNSLAFYILFINPTFFHTIGG